MLLYYMSNDHKHVFVTMIIVTCLEKCLLKICSVFKPRLSTLKVTNKVEDRSKFFSSSHYPYLISLGRYATEVYMHFW